MSVIIANATGETDSAYHSLVKHINSKYPIVMVSWSENFVFNQDLLSLKDYVLVCFCEYGWDLELTHTHVWGSNSEYFTRYYNRDWIKFDNWIKSNPPKLILKRELLKADVSKTVKPIEYPCIIEEQKIDEEWEFNRRPINVFQYWGRSSEHRMRIHGEIWQHAYNKGFQVCDNIYYVSEYVKQDAGEKWVTLWIPHYHRVEIKNLIAINALSKLSLSWKGAGYKCFRTSEAPVNSVMVMTKNDYAFSFDWNETNCILVEEFNEINRIEQTLKRQDLYSVYLNGFKNVDKYRLANYIPFLENIINNV